jgi:5-methylcytosine-specific restriction endonuclease McrA
MIVKKEHLVSRAKELNHKTGKYGINLEFANSRCYVYLINKIEHEKYFTVLQCLYCGNKRECYDYLRAMENVFTYLL